MKTKYFVNPSWSISRIREKRLLKSLNQNHFHIPLFIPHFLSKKVPHTFIYHKATIVIFNSLTKLWGIMLFYAIFLKSAFEFFPSQYVWISFHFGNNSFRKVDILSEFENIFEKRLCFEYGAVSDGLLNLIKDPGTRKITFTYLFVPPKTMRYVAVTKCWWQRRFEMSALLFSDE